MVTYNLINPSDPYTIKAEDPLIASISALILGSGQYGIVGPEGGRSLCPIVGGWEEWLVDNHINLETYIPAHRQELATCLESVLYSRPENRAQIDEEIERLPLGERKDFILKRQETLHSSLNNIGARAFKLAEELRRQMELTQAPPSVFDRQTGKPVQGFKV